MHLEHAVQVAAAACSLNRIQNEYLELKNNATSFSIHELLSSASFNLNQFCTAFTPHPNAPGLIANAKEYSERYGIWLPNAEQYITCCMYLFPHAPLYRMYPIVKNCAVDFYLNDVMGREVYPRLSRAEKNIADVLKERLVSVGLDLQSDKMAGLVETANLEMLKEIAETSTPEWFERFLGYYNYHLEVAHTDSNAAAHGRLLTVEEYIELRCHISGMPHTVALIEYADGFLDWYILREIGVSELLNQLNWAVALIGCLMNDLFSFEKEVIDNNCDSNLIASIALNHPVLKLTGAIQQASKIVQDLLIEQDDLTRKIRESVAASTLARPKVRDRVFSYLEGIERCIQAAWKWQVYTPRYKRAGSIWMETTLKTKV